MIVLSVMRGFDENMDQTGLIIENIYSEEVIEEDGQIFDDEINMEHTDIEQMELYEETEEQMPTDDNVKKEQVSYVEGEQQGEVLYEEATQGESMVVEETPPTETQVIEGHVAFGEQAVQSSDGTVQYYQSVQESESHEQAPEEVITQESYLPGSGETHVAENFVQEGIQHVHEDLVHQVQENIIEHSQDNIQENVIEQNQESVDEQSQSFIEQSQCFVEQGQSFSEQGHGNVELIQENVVEQSQENVVEQSEVNVVEHPVGSTEDISEKVKPSNSLLNSALVSSTTEGAESSTEQKHQYSEDFDTSVQSESALNLTLEASEDEAGGHTSNPEPTSSEQTASTGSDIHASSDQTSENV